jgi:hypothetical protein
MNDPDSYKVLQQPLFPSSSLAVPNADQLQAPFLLVTFLDVRHKAKRNYTVLIHIPAQPAPPLPPSSRNG